jgi:hypothetical protein
MKIFQVKYNQGHFCYYKAESRELINEKTIMYKTYDGCKDSFNEIDTFESTRICKSLMNYFKKPNHE